MADKVILNQRAMDAAKATKQKAVASATSALAQAKSEAPTRAGASILSQGGGADAARYTALAQKLGEFENLADSKLSTSALTKAEQDALTAAENIGIPEAQYASEETTSAYDALVLELTNLGLASLIDPLKKIFQSGITGGSQLTLALQETPEYKTRFSANAERIKKGLRALTPAEYIAKEDAYQNVMRNYGLPASYYTKDATGKQAGFDTLLANDVSAPELEDRVATAQSRVINANPEVMKALKTFYPDITNGDILAYTLDPTKALTDIKRKVTAAEIGGAALAQGLQAGATTAEQLAGYGITKAQAQQGYSTIADILPTGEKLSQIYGESPYTQQQAEQEIFNLGEYKDEKGNLVRMSAVEAAKKRKRLAQMEQATFSGSAGTAGGALSRDRALSTQTYREPGAGAY